MPSHELLIVGDVHGMWDDVDRAFVEANGQDVVIFVGDFGDEDVELVAAIDTIDCPHVVMLGNHDAWFAGRKDGSDDNVHAQIELLGARHLGYGSWMEPTGAYALVGGRPFTWGGGWANLRGLYERLFGVRDTEESAARIVAAATALPNTPLILVGHNGPRGLGEGRDAIFGCDFRQPFVDFGDRDLALALEQLRHEHSRQVVLTVAGHMHHRLVGGGLRVRRVDVDGTVHVNVARVPRHEPYGRGIQRHFVRIAVDITAGRAAVTSAADIWVDDQATVCSTEPLLANAGLPNAIHL